MSKSNTVSFPSLRGSKGRGNPGNSNPEAWVIRCRSVESFIVWHADDHGIVTESDTVPPPDACVAVIIPGEDVLMVHVKLPKTSGSDLRKAIPYALEDHLISDVDDLFFAPGPVDAEGYIDVGVIDRVQLNAYLDTLKQNGIEPSIMLPDFLAITYDEDVVTRMDDEGKSIVRLGECEGFTVETAQIDVFLQGKKRVIVKENAWDWAALTSGVGYSLLQQEYRPRRKAVSIDKKWRFCLYSFIIFCVILFGGQALQWGVLAYRSHKLETQIQEHVKTLYPSSINFTDPRAQLQQLLTQLRHEQRGTLALRLIAQVGVALSAQKNIQLQGLSFFDKKLTITVRAASLASLNVFVKSLSVHAMTVTQNQMHTMKQSVQAQYTVQEAR